MDSQDGDFMLSSPSYRIEKARLRYENLLLSLEEDNVDKAELYIADDTSGGHFDEWNGRRSNIGYNSRAESKQSPGDARNSSSSKAPIKDIYKSVTRRYVINNSPGQRKATAGRNTAMLSSDMSTSQQHAMVQSWKNHQRDDENWGDGLSLQDFVFQDKDDIIVAQQSEIERLKYEFHELKMSTIKENQELRMSLEEIQKTLQKERECHSTEREKNVNDVCHYKSLYEKAKEELNEEKAKLIESLRHLDRLTRRSKSMHAEAGSFSRFHRYPRSGQK